ncbi:COX15/CtaA family protein [Mucilaginibacter sp. SMC90]|uniref:COX15/CtaA family protein n=1 Tax=Mucilaginibacter sp. SMC90 TaxID=2929803 RepID=UPI001FB3B670|nr:COX15/CtaA family protein [Mucilaginibacter sp. SMC90]UOE52941.1 COX15/CtaA family protein [Mucilaginibacter sp. SMC90]
MGNPVNKWLTRWLAAGVLLVLVQIILGGITRLTGSGLSITEWQPLLGALPPMNERSWRLSFEQYQQIAQFKKLNTGFTLADYQHIFFWEWLHREWARLIAIVFVVPFAIFLFKRLIPKSMVWPLIILFALGGLQGAIGWIMVQSGLNDTNVRVDHIRLAIHFSCALLLLCYLFWLFMKTTVHGKLYRSRTNRLLSFILILLGLQLIYGAFMAGTHAALSAPTWPDMNGALIPPNPFRGGQVIYRLTHDLIVIQVVHRSLAYLITVLILLRSFFVKGSALRWTPLVLVSVQVCLGVLSLTHSMFRSVLYFAVVHQLTGILLLLSLVAALYLQKIKPGRPPVV